MIKIFLIVIEILLSIPTGYLLAWLCKDELIKGRKWFKIILFFSLFILIIMLIIGNYPIFFTMIFFIIMTLICLWKSYDRKWTKID